MNSKKLKEFLNSRDIEGVAFDVDNTLLATGEYYRENTKRIGIKIAPKIDDSRDPEEISQEIRDVLQSEYIENGRKPELINKKYIRVVKKYLGKEISKDIVIMVEDFFKDFYLKSPIPFEYTDVVIRSFLDLDRAVVLHSHAQEDWTRIKVDLLEGLVGEKLPYLSTEIDNEKDKDSWLKAFELINYKPANIMVVGDNFEADILPAIEAGCKYLVWLDSYNLGLDDKYSIPSDVELVIINKIEDILTLQ
jgi:phosphoglycolate phosphatase-like HAD superfamily hydrolase